MEKQIVELKRSILQKDGPTYGELFKDGTHLCVTLERPWYGNKPGTSCISPGTYTCIKHNSPKHPDTWEVTNVPGRSAILIHTGNTLADTEGCIIVGSNISPDGVSHSVDAMNFLRKHLPDTFQLVITNP